MTEHLDAFERAQLAKAERTIRRGLRTFVQVGEALLTIRDARLYRETHPTFEDYCRDRWQLSKTHGNRLVQAAAVMRELPAESAPTSERQARELAPLLNQPGLIRRAWATVVHRTGGRPTAAAVREVVRETIPPKTDDSPEPPASPGAGEGAPAAVRGDAQAAGDTPTGETAETIDQTPASSGADGRLGAGEGGTDPAEISGVPAPVPGGAALGDPGALGPRTGSPEDHLPEPQPASPSGEPESGGQADPSASSQAEGADESPPPAGPVADGGDTEGASPGPVPLGHPAGPEEALLTDAEIHAWLTDETSPYYLEELGLRLALVHQVEGAPLARAVAAAARQSYRPGRLPERVKAVRQ